MSYGRVLALLMCMLGLCGAARVAAQDPVPLQIFCYDDFEMWTCTNGPLVVNYSKPPAIGGCDSNAVVSCSPPPDAALPIGTNRIECIATDTCGARVTCAFNIIVAVDTFVPWLSPPSNIVVHTANPAGTHVFYGQYGIDDADHEPIVEFVPATGSFFPLGTNQVLLYAIDKCGNSNGVTFTVEVRKAKVNGGLTPNGLEVGCDCEEGLECADTVDGSYEPVMRNRLTGKYVIPTNSTSRFCRPIVNDLGIPQDHLPEISYVSVGLQSPEYTPGAGLDRVQDDNSTVNGSLIHSAATGGSLNTWSAAINIPFKFWFYGTPRTKICVSKNGLLTFSTNVANTPVGFASDPRRLPNQYFPEDTVACFQSPFTPGESDYTVRAYLEGAAPNRQVWIAWHNVNKPGHGNTHTALVLEETSNRLLMADMYAEAIVGETPPFNTDDIEPYSISNTIIAAPTGTIACGVQRDTNSFTQIPASPEINLVNGALESWDNDFYIFKPYQVGLHVKGDSAASLDFIDDRVVELTKKRNIPGTTVAITYKGRLVYNKAFGFANVEKGIQMLPHHRTQIGSVSKVLTAAGIFKCIQMGFLDLTNRIVEPQLMGQQWFFDAFQMGIDAGVHSNQSWNHLNAITLEHLMNHTSGYARSADGVKAAELFNNGVFATSSYTNGMRWFMARQPFVTNGPGLRASYSNHGPGQLGVIIQNVTGLAYEEFMQQYVLNPHGITKMRIGKPQWLQQNQQLDARRYHWYNSGSPHGKNPFHGQLAPVTYDATTEHPGAQGSWTGTARDLARFMVATDQLNNRSDILPPHLLRIMETNSMTNVTGFAKGWARSETTGRLSHNGNIGYGASYIQKNTNGVNIAVTCNTGESDFCTDLAVGIFGDLDADVLSQVPQFYDLFGGQLQLQDN